MLTGDFGLDLDLTWPWNGHWVVLYEDQRLAYLLDEECFLLLNHDDYEVQLPMSSS
jgi:hypothetical protein